MKIAIIGATGLVGRTMINVLEERKFPISELILAASSRSAGQLIKYNDKDVQVITLEEALEKNIDIALFSAGSEVSKIWAPQFATKGTFVIDNSSCWRMDLNIPLIIPEVNGVVLTSEDKIIANPNCSTIQIVAALAPLHQKYRIKKLVISTYQSVSGSGVKGIEQLKGEQKGQEVDKVYPHIIHENIIPHGGDFLEDGYTEEEVKLINETRKILGDDRIKISPTVARVPVIAGHSASVHISFSKKVSLSGVKDLLQNFPGIQIIDNPSSNEYPTPLLAEGKDEVFVGRIRRDLNSKKAISIWIVADNLRKGAATNAVQIAEFIVNQKFIQE